MALSSLVFSLLEGIWAQWVHTGERDVSLVQKPSGKVSRVMPGIPAMSATLTSRPLDLEFTPRQPAAPGCLELTAADQWKKPGADDFRLLFSSEMCKSVVLLVL